jgi:hypothetical protein
MRDVLFLLFLSFVPFCVETHTFIKIITQKWSTLYRRDYPPYYTYGIVKST